MILSDEDFKKDLLRHKVFSAWQFIQFTRKNIETVQYCHKTIENVIDKLSVKTVRWEQDLFSDFLEDVTVDGKKAKRVTLTTEYLPVYEMRVAGEKIDPWFLFDKLLRDFYQYSMNAFDSISQVANAGLLADNEKAVDSVDFQRMVKCFAQTTYSAAFPKTSAWFAQINASPEYQYIEAINNRTKHTADIANKLSMGILGSANNAKIGPFFRKDVQHKEKNLTDQLQATIDFLSQSFDNFLTSFCDEYIQDTYVDNRRHNIGGVYQQHLMDEPDQDLSYAYIEVENDFQSMPEELFILLAKEGEDEIYAHTCPFEHILIRNGDGHDILGRYSVETAAGDDCLLKYRKYVKDNQTVGAACIFYEQKEQTQFYHHNPYFNVTIVSDDNQFLGRASLPF